MTRGGGDRPPCGRRGVDKVACGEISLQRGGKATKRAVAGYEEARRKGERRKGGGVEEGAISLLRPKHRERLGFLRMKARREETAKLITALVQMLIRA